MFSRDTGNKTALIMMLIVSIFARRYGLTQICNGRGLKATVMGAFCNTLLAIGVYVTEILSPHDAALTYFLQKAADACCKQQTRQLRASK